MTKGNMTIGMARKTYIIICDPWALKRAESVPNYIWNPIFIIKNL